MAVRAQDARAISVVEQDEFARHLVLVRGDGFAEGAEVGIAVAFFEVAEHLVVRAVFFDDINDVLEHRGLAGPFGHRSRRLAGAGTRPGCFEQGRPIVVQHATSVAGQLAFRRHGD